MHNTRLSLILGILFAVVAVPLRLLSGFGRWSYNMQPVGGLGVYSGARVSGWLAYVLPLSVMVITDLVLWASLGELYSPLHISRAAVYACFMLFVLLGRWLVINNNPLRMGAASLTGSIVFYLITNFAAWVEYSHLYSRDITGLWQSYVAAWPFFQWSLISDLFFTGVLFGIHLMATKAAAEEPEATPAR